MSVETVTDLTARLEKEWPIRLETRMQVYIEDDDKVFNINSHPCLSKEEWEEADLPGKRELLATMYDEIRDAILRQWDVQVERYFNDAT